MSRKTDRKGNAGASIVSTIVNRDMEWIYRSQDQAGTDYGIDAHIEVTDGDGVETGRLIAAQIKAGASRFREGRDDGFIFRPKDRHVTYWRSSSLPVIVILVDETASVAYWAVTSGIEATKSGGWKLLVPRHQRLDASSKPALSAIASGAGTERTRAKKEERERDAELERRIAELEDAVADYVAQLAAQPSEVPSAPSDARIDILRLSFAELLDWVDRTDFIRDGVEVSSRTAYVIAAQHLFFRETIGEHDAAKAITLLLLAQEWGKAASVFLYALDLARKMPRVETPSITNFLAAALLPDEIPLDLRIILRSLQIRARRKHGRGVERLLDELDSLIDAAGVREAWSVAATAFVESLGSGRRAPLRALGYITKAALLRPGAKGHAGMAFPDSLDSTWSLMLELTAAGVAASAELEAWLAALAAIPKDARSAVMLDEMNCVTLANRFWLDESAKPEHERAWRSIHDILTRIEEWSAAHSAPLLFASARRGRVVIRGEYEDDLRGAIALATEVPTFVLDDAHAMFLLNEIAASQLLYAGAHMESYVAFRETLAYRPKDSSVLSSTVLKAAQAAGAAGEFAQAVEWTHDAVDVIDASAYRATTDSPVARAEYALALWFAGGREAALDAWDSATEELFAVEEDTARWRGLVVRFAYVGGYLANMARSGTPPKVDAEGKPYVEPRPGAFLIDLAGQASAFTDDVRFGVLLGLAMMSELRAADERTRRWIYEALTLATERIPDRRPITGLPALPILIRDGRFADAVDLARAMTGTWQNLMKDAQSEVVAVSFSVVPSVLSIALMPSVDAASAGRLLMDACCAAFDESDNEIWRKGANLVEVAFLSNADLGTRVAALRAIQQSGADAADESPLPMLADIISTLIRGAPIDACLAAHARALPGLNSRLSIFAAMYRLHIVPFFFGYWRRRVTNETSAFTNAPDVLAGIAATESVAINERAHAILSVVARGVVLC